MSNYHLAAIKNALHSVQLSGHPREIGAVYEAHLPPGETLAGLVKSYGLMMRFSKSTGRTIVEKPYGETQ